jgi:uncharacterized protein (DUF1330 family)
MAAWLVVTAHVLDREAFMQGYGPAAAALLQQFGGTYVVRAPGAVQLEGEGKDGGSVVVSEWENREAALRFWNSPEYTEVKKMREGLADVSVVLVGA